MESNVTDEWLESLAFFHEEGYPLHVRLIRTNGHTLETWRRYTDTRNERKWVLNGALVNPQPRNRTEVRQLLKRLRT